LSDLDEPVDKFPLVQELSTELCFDNG